jgi:hypothetical protein
MNHKKMFRQIFGCGQLLDNYEKATSALKEPTKAEYDNLSDDIKKQFKTYEEYKTHVNANNVVTKTAMKAKLEETKSNYIEYTKATAKERDDFYLEADALIGIIEDKRIEKIDGSSQISK